MLPYIIGAIIGIVVGLAVGIPVGIRQRKNSAEREIGSAEEEAKRIVNEAYKSAEQKARGAGGGQGGDPEGPQRTRAGG